MIDPNRTAQLIADRYAAYPETEAVALSGSLTGDAADEFSDIDLYVYSRDELPLSIRAAVCEASAHERELDNRFWEPGDEWLDKAGIKVDVMFRLTAWIEDRVEDNLTRGRASVGYSTCFWHNVLYSRILYDRNGWFQALQHRCRAPYPPELKRSVIAKNYPILRNTLSSYRTQIRNAFRRQDFISVNHRTAAFLASYFDVVFALNERTHPGEKRLLNSVSALPGPVPGNLRQNLAEILTPEPTGAGVLNALDRLVDELDRCLEAEGQIPRTS